MLCSGAPTWADAQAALTARKSNRDIAEEHPSDAIFVQAGIVEGRVSAVEAAAGAFPT